MDASNPNPNPYGNINTGSKSSLDPVGFLLKNAFPSIYKYIDEKDKFNRREMQRLERQTQNYEAKSASLDRQRATAESALKETTAAALRKVTRDADAAIKKANDDAQDTIRTQKKELEKKYDDLRAELQKSRSEQLTKERIATADLNVALEEVKQQKRLLREKIVEIRDLPKTMKAAGVGNVKLSTKLEEELAEKEKQLAELNKAHSALRTAHENNVKSKETSRKDHNVATSALEKSIPNLKKIVADLTAAASDMVKAAEVTEKQKLDDIRSKVANADMVKDQKAILEILTENGENAHIRGVNSNIEKIKVIDEKKEKLAHSKVTDAIAAFSGKDGGGGGLKGMIAKYLTKEVVVAALPYALAVGAAVGAAGVAKWAAGKVMYGQDRLLGKDVNQATRSGEMREALMSGNDKKVEQLIQQGKQYDAWKAGGYQPVGGAVKQQSFVGGVTPQGVGRVVPPGGESGFGGGGDAVPAPTGGGGGGGGGRRHSGGGGDATPVGTPTDVAGIAGAGGALGATIAHGEGGYGSFNRGNAGDAHGAKINFSDMTLGQIMAQQALPKGSSNRLFAVGKYQVIPSTMRDAVRTLGLKSDTKFTPEVQEKIAREYLMDKKRPQVRAYITGKNENLHGAQLALAQEFASIGHPDTGRSIYGGSGNNKASTSPQQVASALQKERAKYQENLKSGMSPNEAWAALSGSVQKVAGAPAAKKPAGDAVPAADGPGLLSRAGSALGSVISTPAEASTINGHGKLLPHSKVSFDALKAASTPMPDYKIAGVGESIPPAAAPAPTPSPVPEKKGWFSRAKEWAFGSHWDDNAVHTKEEKDAEALRRSAMAVDRVGKLSGLSDGNSEQWAKIRKFMADGGAGMSAADKEWCARTYQSAETQVGIHGKGMLAKDWANTKDGEYRIVDPSEGLKKGMLGVSMPTKSDTAYGKAVGNSGHLRGIEGVDADGNAIGVGGNTRMDAKNPDGPHGVAVGTRNKDDIRPEVIIAPTGNALRKPTVDIDDKGVVGRGWEATKEVASEGWDATKSGASWAYQHARHMFDATPVDQSPSTGADLNAASTEQKASEAPRPAKASTTIQQTGADHKPKEHKTTSQKVSQVAPADEHLKKMFQGYGAFA